MSETSTAGREAAAQRSDVLGESTRSRILRYLEGSGAPVRVAVIAADLGLNHTGIRRHLAVLRDAGLVVEEHAPARGPGRAALEYRATRTSTPGSSGGGAYEELTLLLLDLRQNDQSPRAAGAEYAQRVVSGEPAGRSLERLEEEMARRGFEPELRPTASGVDLVAGRCGVEAAAAADPDVVCELHVGLIEGILQGMGGELVLRAATPRDPTGGGCRFRIARTGPVDSP